MIGITKHRNQHVVIETYNYVTFVNKLLVAEKEFEKALGHSLGDNDKTINTNLFWKGTIALTKGIFLQNYICRIQKN